MFHDYYYAHSFAVMYRVESSVEADGSYIMKCCVFDANCQTFDPAPLKLKKKQQPGAHLKGLAPLTIEFWRSQSSAFRLRSLDSLKIHDHIQIYGCKN